MNYICSARRTRAIPLRNGICVVSYWRGRPSGGESENERETEREASLQRNENDVCCLPPATSLEKSWIVSHFSPGTKVEIGKSQNWGHKQASNLKAFATRILLLLFEMDWDSASTARWWKFAAKQICIVEIVACRHASSSRHSQKTPFFVFTRHHQLHPRPSRPA